MTITLTANEDQELWDEAALYIPPQYDPTIGSELHAMPRQLGSGYDFYFEPYPECWLGIFGVAELMYDMASETQKQYSKQDGIFCYINS